MLIVHRVALLCRRTLVAPSRTAQARAASVGWGSSSGGAVTSHLIPAASSVAPALATSCERVGWRETGERSPLYLRALPALSLTWRRRLPVLSLVSVGSSSDTNS